MTTSAEAVAAQAPPAADRVVAVLLLVALGLVSPVVTFLALMFSMVSDGCGGGAPCNTDQIGLGIAVAGLAPWAALLGATLVVVKRVRQRRRAWWVPLVAALLGAVVFAAGALMAAAAVG